MRVMGMDPSVRSFGVAFRMANGKLWTACISPPENMRGVERLVFIENALVGYISKYKPDIVAYENYAFSRARAGSRAITGLAELGGVVKRLLYMQGIGILSVPPTSLKLFATGKGRAEKDEVALYIQREEGIMFATSDQNDAAVLLKVGEAKVNARLLPRNRAHYQRKAVAGCDWEFAIGFNE